jgi:hypothetical protein
VHPLHARVDPEAHHIHVPMLEDALTLQAEPLIVPRSAAPLRGACQVTVGASARAAKGKPA